MNIETTFTWERSPGEEIELKIGGEYSPAGQDTEYDRFQSDMASLDWVEQKNGIRLDWYNFTPDEICAMDDTLLEAARIKYAAQHKPQFPGLRKLMDLEIEKPERPFVI